MENNEFVDPNGLIGDNDNMITPSANPEETPIEIETFEGITDLMDDLDDNPVDPVDDPPQNNEPKDTPPADDDKETSAYDDIVAHYQSQGWLGDISEYEDDDFKFDGTKESFEELLERKSYQDAISILERDILPNLPASARKTVELMLKEDLSADDADVIGDAIATYSEMNKETFEKDVEKAKATYKAYLKSKGMDDDEIDDFVQKAVDLEEITDKAEKARIKLLEKANSEIKEKQEKAKQEEAKRAEDQKKRLEIMKSNIAAFKEQVNKGGFPINDKIVEDIFKSRTEIAGYSKDKRPLNKFGLLSEKDPEGVQNILHLLTAMDVFQTDKNGQVRPNFDKLMKATASQATKKVASNIEKISKKFAPVGTKNANNEDSDEPTLDALKQLIN